MSSLEVVFLICNYGVIPFWFLLVFLPKSPVTHKLVHSGLFAGLLVPAYALLLWTDSPGPQNASFFTLEGVSRIFTSPQTILACWIHYLIFDLFVGAWAARDAARRKLPQILVAPCLVLTLLFGPAGLGLYLLIRGVKTKTWSLAEGVQ